MGDKDKREGRSWTSDSAEATEALGAELGRLLPRGSVVTLDGDLGSGKTCLVRGIARGLGIAGAITSPTYTLMAAHGTEPDGGQARCPLYHYDAWMEGREKAFLSAGGGEWMHGDGVAVIEWGSRIAAWLPEERLSIFLSHLDPNRRQITLTAPPGPLAHLLGSLVAPEGLREDEGL
jgi:tRNA threonylcarbamoyladenosine biosynthesis protein TsaE